MDEAIIQQEINKYKKFKKVDGATYRKVNFFLRKRTYITAREWALARLCTDFRTSGGAEMTFIGQHLPELVPFMEDTYSPQAVNQARHSFKKKVRKSGATFFYGAMCGFFSTDELDDLLFEASEVSRFLLEVEGTTIDIDDEIDIEDRITKVMRSVGETAKTILKTRSSDNDVEAPRDITPSAQSIPTTPHKSQQVRSHLKRTASTPIIPVAEHPPDNNTSLPSPDQKATGGTDPGPKNTPVDSLPLAEPVTPTTDSTGSRDPSMIASLPEIINPVSNKNDPAVTPTDTKETPP
jgi:uncharacterized protein YqgV (UPF0045/DUF77 family)